MYKKVVDNDGILENVNDKRTSCILLLNGLITIIDNIHSKVLTLNDLELLEEMVVFTRGIYLLVFHIVGDYCKEEVSEMNKRPGQFYPLICKARQMDIFSLLSDIHCMLNRLKKKKYFHTCNKVGALNSFLRNLKSSLVFLEKFLVKHKHFHVVLPTTREETSPLISKILLVLHVYCMKN